MASAGFDMNELRLNLKNMDYLKGPGSGASSGRFSHSPRSTTKSILRGQVGSPKQGSPSSGRSVRFTDSNVKSSAGAVELFPKLHINEATQTNGELEEDVESFPRLHLDEATQTNYGQEDHDLEIFTQLLNEETQTGDDLGGYYDVELAAKAKGTQTELPQGERITTGIRHFTKHKPLSVLSRGTQAKPDANPPRGMPQAPNDGHKIVQNFDLTVPKVNPKISNNSENVDDGKRIVQNMIFEPKIRSVAVQTVDMPDCNKTTDIPDGKKIIRNLEVARPKGRLHLNENWDELMHGIPNLSVSSPRNRNMPVQYESPRVVKTPKHDKDERSSKKEPVLIYSADNITPRSDVSQVNAGLKLNLFKDEVVDDIVSPRQGPFSAPNSARSVPHRQPYQKKTWSAASSPRSKMSLSSPRSSGESTGSKIKLTDFLKRQTFKYSSLHLPYKHVSSVTRTNLQEPKEEQTAAYQTPKSERSYDVHERATDTELDMITDAQALDMKETIGKLKMTNVETHSFVPISKPEERNASSKNERCAKEQLIRNEKVAKENLARNTFIKGVDLGPSPTQDLLTSTGKMLEEYLNPSVSKHMDRGTPYKTFEPIKPKVDVAAEDVIEKAISHKTSQQMQIPPASHLKCVCGPTNFQRTPSAASYIASRPATCVICNTLTPNLAQLRNKAIRKHMTSIGSESTTGDDDSSMLSSPRNAHSGGYSNVHHNTKSSPVRMSRPVERTFGRSTREYRDGTRSISPRDVSAERGPTNIEFLEAQTHTSNVKPGPTLESDLHSDMFSPRQIGIDLMSHSPRRNVNRSRSRSPRGMSPGYSPPRKPNTSHSSYTAYDHPGSEKPYQAYSLYAKPPLPTNTKPFKTEATQSRLDTLQRRPSPNSRRSVGGRPEYSANQSVSMRPRVGGLDPKTSTSETHDDMRMRGVGAGIEPGRKPESATGNKITIGKAPTGIADTDCVFLDEDTIQKIIEQADL